MAAETNTTDSILKSIKKLLGYEFYDEFDPDIIMFINAAISDLRQIGVGPEDGFSITGDNETYEDLIKNHSRAIGDVRMFIYYKTKLGFDPPSSGSVMQNMKEMLRETEWRLNSEFDPPNTYD